MVVTVAACSGNGGAPDAGFDYGPPPPDVGPPDGPPAPLEAPPETWTWIDVPGMTCGDGSPTGVGVNLSTRSARVVVFLNGGGACWDAQTCFELHTAASIDTPFAAAEFDALRPNLDAYPLFARVAANPYADASFVFVPYCTGDLHAGHQVQAFGTATGPRTVHFVGQANLDALWPRLRATRPTADRVLLAGASAGGYGAMLEQGRLRAAWPEPRVDVLSDSSHPIDPVVERWTAMRTAWSLDLPAGCSGCLDGFAAWPAYLRSVAPAGARWGLLMNTRDQVIASYFGVTQAALAPRTLAIRDAMTLGSGQAAFVIDATSHVLTTTTPAPTTSGGVALGDWVRQFAADDPAWASVGP